jgi:hypothetical protein
VQGKEAADVSSLTGETIDFDSAFIQLQAAVRRACRGHSEWQAKIAAGIRAALDFAARNPLAASTLTIEDGVFRAGVDGTRHPELIEYFSAIISEIAPPQLRLSASTNDALISTIVTVVVVHLRSGTKERLPDAAPDLVHLTLLPYTGFVEAQRWAEFSTR